MSKKDIGKDMEDQKMIQSNNKALVIGGGVGGIKAALDSGGSGSGCGAD